LLKENSQKGQAQHIRSKSFYDDDIIVDVCRRVGSIAVMRNGDPRK